jgi:N-methylhydantoinase B
MSEPIDPMLLAVISNRLDGVVKEMTNTLLRTGRSALLNTARDFSCSVVTADSELLTAAQGLPIHCGGSDLLSKAMHRFHGEDIQPGDAFLHNDPYNGNTHHADYSVLAPVFVDGEHMFTAIAKAHQADCGNSRPTTYASYAGDVYEEGALNLPCVRIQRDHHDVDDIVRMCRARIRVPEQWYGDYLATLGAARIGERRLKEVVDRYGKDLTRRFVQEWFDYSERRVEATISKLPSGTVEAEGRHDPVPGMPDGIPVSAKVRIDAEVGRVEVDLRDNIDCQPIGFNLSEACARSSALAGVLNGLQTELPLNAGTFRRIDVLLRQNCLVGIPPKTASCSVATTNVADRVISVVQMALAFLGDGFGLAEGGMGMGPGMGVIAGADARRDGAPYINQLFLSVYGGPASAHQDGWSAFGVPVDGGLMYRDSVEIVEQKYPIVIEELRLMQDSEGPGKFRGAPGSKVTLGPHGGPMSISYLTDGFDNPSRGAQGGEGPGIHDTYVIRADGTRMEVDKVGDYELQPGERIVESGGGGGGYGSPLERDPERVLRDVSDGLVSVERAHDVYGVAVVAGGHHEFRCDAGATRQLREATPAVA